MADDNEQRLTDGVSVDAIKAFLADLKRQFPDTHNEMTTADACKQLVVPRTHGASCAYVDLLRKQSPESVGKATVFVSHAWRYKIADVLNVLLEFAEEQATKDDSKPVFFWFDLFMNNQNANVTANLPQEWWSTTFKESIANIGRVLLVLMPWQDPVPLTRAWCLWEIFCGISNEGTEVDIRLPNSEQQALEGAICENYKAVTDTLVRVQAERAEAFNPHDKDMIFNAIESWAGGFGAVNQAVKDQLRAWCLDNAEAAVEGMQARGEDDTEVFAALCSQVGLVLREFGEHNKAREYFEKAKAIYVETLGEKHPSTADAYINLGLTYDDKGDFDQAIDLYQKAKQIQAETLGNNHPGTAAVCSSLGNAYYAKGKYDKAIAYYQEDLAITSEALGEKHPSAAQTYSNIGNVYYAQGEYDSAIKQYEKAMEINLEALGEKHPGTANTHNNIGNVYFGKGEYDRAIEHFEKARKVYVETLGEKHPTTAIAYKGIGNALSSKGEHDTAIEYYAAAKAIRLETLGPTHPDTAESFSDFGNAHSEIGEYGVAIDHLEAAKEIHLQTLGEEHPTTAYTFNNLAAAYDDMGEYSKAMKYYERARAIKAAVLGEKHSSMASTCTGLGNLYSKMGKHAEAIQCFEKAKEIQVATLGEVHPTTALTLESIGAEFAEQGRMDRARVFFEQALDAFTATLGPDHPHTRAAEEELRQARRGNGAHDWGEEDEVRQHRGLQQPAQSMAGWLQKRRRWRGSFHACWVFLEAGTHLVYSKGPEETARQRRIPLSTVRSAELARDGKDLRVACRGRTFVFRQHECSNAALTDWCSAIQAALSSNPNQTV
ncbi:mbre TPR repeat protein [Salpingoeca rosetta]|uniref:Mbre TPR repeat protein n=1 Tax=Salpingoeca rosetta (strain ATCC 50818 / BSB-021) TaxID=946362 RepID=F2UR97_SALR5|nr:mbre TPR repeat protein [Salpingoeca rosetta]EGD80200.1 mbre TPR repeat protein [Salpingoeca rosetta]|eukprot:XP_004988262.1 mbre TPR repeat protein [Salpingoeca rosetta]